MSETTDERKARDRISFLRTLRAERTFRTDPVPHEVVDDILEVARWSGSASNKQPWEIVVIRERDTLRSLAAVDGYAGHLAGAPLGMVLVMNGDRAEQETYDEGRLAERIMLAAAAHGLGSAIGWFKDAASDEAKRILGVPAERLLRTIISVGSVDAEARRQRTRPEQPRKPLDQIVHHERW
jgi:nitroreductase